ncbi:hypothetical protein BD410DRAFT_900998 [Rickenella mellea]|uniref:Uncharacterized protein n=1 Tax=Rickenella mellea TaxID=50990 RepID=A0A4Y7PS93_9AGAM|nr:hypothetical protein BD410DRAFT_900998 [Rickenella mellea]
MRTAGQPNEGRTSLDEVIPALSMMNDLLLTTTPPHDDMHSYQWGHDHYAQQHGGGEEFDHEDAVDFLVFSHDAADSDSCLVLALAFLPGQASDRKFLARCCTLPSLPTTPPPIHNSNQPTNQHAPNPIAIYAHRNCASSSPFLPLLRVSVPLPLSVWII